ncbi:ROK family transcriptional regulator [Mesorhizobium retamae]|uniref:ROK family transcriptional regulator n=1 Tax=Mesorhizobium retamae TaxID=2912854 RepID=A0ABS9QEY2_9HYPH|nr:ROK family transcriptional regulator [Mesorhizobium sp. IRAMC:0171]MCG7505356.1 ROK family transcriptional regulator [Mesorhizobium sp. IRAMC:0171]
MSNRSIPESSQLSANTPADMRSHNRRVILHALRLHGSLSRAELARTTGLTPQAVANIVEGLEAAGLVRQAGRRRSSRGQPPIEIEISKDGGYALGIRVDDSHLLAVAVNLVGEVIETRRDARLPRDTGEWVDYVAEIHVGFAERHNVDRCLGVGIVTPGPFDVDWPGIPSPGSVRALQSRNIVERIALRTGVDVFLENDATAAAIGERLYGEAKDVNNFFYVFVGEGVGGGIVIRGQPYRGFRGNAGEFGHIIVDPAGPQCYCGNKGCLGEYLSLASMRQSLGPDFDLSDGNHPDFTRWILQAAQALSVGLASVENLFDPEIVIIGGTAPTWMLNRLVEALGTLRPSVRQDGGQQRLRLSKLGEESGALGAAALPILAATSSV